MPKSLFTIYETAKRGRMAFVYAKSDCFERSRLFSLFGNSFSYTSMEELNKVKLDGVFIHLATSVHFDIAKSFLKRGIPVYMDKPLNRRLSNDSRTL